jgi:hypothetical protein
MVLLDWTTCFLLASFFLAVSWIFLAKTREPDRPPADTNENQPGFWNGVSAILQRDANFRWFLAARALAQMATIAFGFYTALLLHVMVQDPHHVLRCWQRPICSE